MREFVVETALATVADSFGLDGVVLAAQQEPPGVGPQPAADELTSGRQTEPAAPSLAAVSGDQSPAPGARASAPTFLAAKLPVAWASDSQILFETYGNLWRVLQDDRIQVQSSLVNARLNHPVPATERWQLPVGRHWLWVARVDDGDHAIAAAAIRRASFPEPEADALGAVVRSIVAACSEDACRAESRYTIGQGTSVSLKSEGPIVQAEVQADWVVECPPAESVVSGRRVGVGRGQDPAGAVARAAAKACRPRCEIEFAGASSMDGLLVTIVMIRDHRQALRLGFAVRPEGDHSGAAEAVFTAAG